MRHRSVGKWGKLIGPVLSGIGVYLIRSAAALEIFTGREL